MTGEIVDSEDEYDEISELRQRNKPETQESVDVRLFYWLCEQLNDFHFRRPSTWMTYCPSLGNLANIRNFSFLVFVCLLAFHVASVLSTNCSWPTHHMIIGVPYLNSWTWMSNNGDIWQYPRSR